ncbi:MAG TPA: hypothetical protein VMT55_01635, partial [Candidatus Sulfotelmatobacter sp.]|nr:hypothetical protein [Candidatus Sulfotelmatobacter sp.]
MVTAMHDTLATAINPTAPRTDNVTSGIDISLNDLEKDILAEKVKVKRYYSHDNRDDFIVDVKIDQNYKDLFNIFR